MDTLRLHTRKAVPMPKGLSGKAAAFWKTVLQDFELEPFHFAVLEQACRSLARAEEARAKVDAEGQVYVDQKSGRLFPHPSTIIEERSRAAFVRCVRELGLDLDQSEPARPPTRAGRARR